MSKRISKKIIIITSCIAALAVCTTAAIYCSVFFQKNITIVNDKIYSEMLPTDNFKKYYTPELKFDDMKVSEIDDVSISLLGEKLKLKKMLLNLRDTISL